MSKEPSESQDDPQELPAFFGSFASGKPDLADRIDEILRAETPAE